MVIRVYSKRLKLLTSFQAVVFTGHWKIKTQWLHTEPCFYGLGGFPFSFFFFPRNADSDIVHEKSDTTNVQMHMDEERKFQQPF